MIWTVRYLLEKTFYYLRILFIWEEWKGHFGYTCAIIYPFDPYGILMAPSKVCNNVMLNTNHSMRHLWEMLYSIDSHSPHIHIPEMKTLTFLTWTYKRSKSFTSIITQSSKIHILCLAWITNNWWIRGTKVNNYILRIENW